MQRHWSAAYLGRPYVEGRFDCADLVVAVEADVFGRALALPTHATTTRARDAQVAALSTELAVPLAPGAARAEGDAVLMRALGRQRVAGHHLGVWCAPGAVPSVLHCLAGLGTCLHRLAALPPHLECTGVYRWR